MTTAITLELLEQMSALQIALLNTVEAQVGQRTNRPSRAVLGAHEALDNTLQLMHYQFQKRGDETMQEDIDHLRKKFKYVECYIEKERAKLPKPLPIKVYMMLKKKVSMSLQSISKAVENWVDSVAA
jgi:hypothetical protein